MGKVLMMNTGSPFQATFDNVVLERHVFEAAGGIILPGEAAASIEKKWKVINVGPDVKSVEVGQFIVFNSATAGEIEWHDGKKYVVLPVKDIVAICK